MNGVGREANADFINWLRVDTGNGVYTPNKPLGWRYEMPAEDAAAIRELAKMTPTNAMLRLLAANNPPTQQWLDQDEEPPF
jgi:hypothetical protein